MSLFFLWNPLQKFEGPGGSCQGGNPEEKLERTRGATSCRQNAYRDSHRLWPKSTTPRRCLGTKLGTVAKEPWSSSKAQNIKEGISLYNQGLRSRGLGGFTSHPKGPGAINSTLDTTENPLVFWMCFEGTGKLENWFPRLPKSIRIRVRKLQKTSLVKN